MKRTDTPINDPLFPASPLTDTERKIMAFIEWGYSNFTATPMVAEIAKMLGMPTETVRGCIYMLQDKCYVELTQPFGQRQVIRLLRRM